MTEVTSEPLRVAIVGAGAMGSILGAAFMAGGAETVLVDVSEPLVEHLNRAGVAIERDGETRTVAIPATTDPASIGTVDAVVFFVKGYQTAAAAELAAPLVGESTVVATLQNGWGNGDVLAEYFGAERTVVGVTYNSGTVAGLGHVLHTNAASVPTFLGPYRGNDLEGAERIARTIKAGGLQATSTSSAGDETWKKLVMNTAALPPAAMTRLTASGLANHEPVLRVVESLARETVAVAVAAGYSVDVEERVETIRTALAGAGSGKASMLQDIEAGRRTEIDTINGAVVRVADSHGVDVPMNRAMVALVTGYEVAAGLR